MSILSGKTSLFTAMSVVAILSTGVTAQAVPVVPNFQQGQMTTHTETTSEVVEVINSMDYNTGYTYSVSGHGVEPQSGTNITPSGTESISVQAPSSSTNSNLWPGELDLDGLNNNRIKKDNNKEIRINILLADAFLKKRKYVEAEIILLKLIKNILNH